MYAFGKVPFTLFRSSLAATLHKLSLHAISMVRFGVVFFLNKKVKFLYCKLRFVDGTVQFFQGTVLFCTWLYGSFLRCNNTFCVLLKDTISLLTICAAFAVKSIRTVTLVFINQIFTRSIVLTRLNVTLIDI